MTGTLPVVDGPWFSIEPAPAGLTLISEPYVHPFLRCNIWHVRGTEADMLVDTGLGLQALAAAFPEIFDGRRTVAVATHYHFDHTGGLHEFDERWIHKEEGGTAADAQAIGGQLRTTGWSDRSRELVTAAGYELPADGELLMAVPAASFDPDRYAVTAAQPTRLLDDGDVVDLGDRAFEVLHLPGHSPGSIGLWEPESGILFSGDAVYDGPLLDFGESSSVEDYVRTMERLVTLPVRVVHGGHERSFGRDRLIELCQDYLRRQAG